MIIEAGQEEEKKEKQRYRKIQRVGEGTYGTVYKAMDNHLKCIVALKKIRLECEGDGIPASTLWEICLLKSVDHVNVVKLLDVDYRPL